ncbi:MAG: hypothetical protein ACE5F6_00935, partial [Anaerolineae bacterium]
PRERFMVRLVTLYQVQRGGPAVGCPMHTRHFILSGWRAVTDLFSQSSQVIRTFFKHALSAGEPKR